MHPRITFSHHLPGVFKQLLQHPLAGYVQSTLLVLLVLLISIPIHWVIEPVNLVMLYLAAVVVAAVYLGRGPAVLASSMIGGDGMAGRLAPR